MKYWGHWQATRAMLVNVIAIILCAFIEIATQTDFSCNLLGRIEDADCSAGSIKIGGLINNFPVGGLPVVT